MKKFLSLVLALVMTMSLVTISAGAKDFTDDSKITYDEAIAVMSEVKVIDGYADGSFNPTATLTRGAAAKIICNLILGPTTASALSADAAPYSDVPANSTFAGYIAYCAKAGIISGYADGTFKPGNTLTGYAFMKMLLGALGYDKSVEGYDGTNWSINVAKQALGIGLDAGLLEDFDGTKPVTREEACLYALNTLKATMVEYDAKTSISVGGAEVTIAGSKAQDVNQGTYKSFTNDPADETLEFCEKYFKDLKLVETADDFGRPSNQWKLKNTEIGTFANKADLVETFTKKVTKSTMYETVGKSVYDALCDNDAKLSVWFDGVETKVSAANIDTYIEKNNSGTVNSTGNGDVTEVYVDSDSNVTVVTIRTYVFQAVGDYDSKKETVTLGTPDSANADTAISLVSKTLDVDDFPAIEDFEDEDYILVTAVNSDGKYDVKSVAKAEVVTGEVLGYKLSDNVELGGTTYSYNAGTTSGGIKTTSYTVGQQASLVLDAYGYVIAVDEAIVLSDYVYISAFGSTSGLNTKAVANAIFPDGTSEEIVVKEAYDKKTPSNGQVKTKSSIVAFGTDPKNIGWFTYSKNSAGEYTLYNIESKYTEPKVSGQAYAATYGASTAVSYNNKVVFLAGQSYLANNDTVFIVSDKDDDLTVYTGVKNAPEISTLSGASANVYLLHKSTGSPYASVVYIDITGNATISGEKDANLVYVTKFNGTHKTTDNEVYYTYKVLVDGKEEVVKADNKINGLDSDIYGVANYVTKNSDDMLTGFQLVDTSGSPSGVLVGDTAQNDAITYSAGTLSIDGTSYVVADDAKIDLVILKNANVLNKDKDASYEVAANISAKELADSLKGYNCTYDYALKTTESGNGILKELYVTVTGATPTVTPVVPTITGATVNTAPVTTYATVADAVANATVVDYSTAVTIAGVGTGATSWTVAVDGGYTTGAFVADYADLPSFTVGAADEVIVAKLTATNTVGNSTPTYIAIKVVNQLTLTVTNNDADTAIMVTYNGQDYVVAKKGTSATVVTLDTKLVKDDVITVKYVVEDGGAIGAVTCTGAASSTLFNKTFNITVGTTDIDIAVANG